MAETTRKTEPPPFIANLAKRIDGYSSGVDTSLISKAFQTISEGAVRNPDGKTALEHAKAIAEILVDMRMDPTTIAAGMLYEALGGGELDKRLLIRRFGEYVVFLVESLAKLEKITFQTREAVLAENFRKMVLAMGKDLRVIMIKFADRLHRMRILDPNDDDAYRYAQETLDIYAPLANRLGIGWLKVELEDRAFAHLDPEGYKDLAEKVMRRQASQGSYMEAVIRQVRTMMEQQGIPGQVLGRVKHLHGIYQKLQRQQIPFDQVYDVLGLRIITESKADCYAALGMLHSTWTPIPGRFKDFIGAPKSNLYQSIHTTVIGPDGEKVEFQIRTEEMHRIAEGGIAAHWRYKERRAINPEDEKIFSWLRDIIGQQKDLPDSKDFLDTVRGDLFPEVVYVFTPKGDVKEMPSGSTPLDFAYGVHTQVGHHCTGARVNGRIVPLRYELQTGDTVEIFTGHSQRPSRDWLKIVHTSRARNRIRQWLREEERKRSLELGRHLLEREIRRRDLSPKVMEDPAMDEVAKRFGAQTVEDLVVAVGYGKVNPLEVVRRFLPESAEEKEPSRQRKRKRKEQQGIRIKGIDGLLYHFSKCCFPIPGDAVVGFVTRGKGVSIHGKDCPTLNSLSVDRERLIDVAWVPSEDETYPVKIAAYTEDRPGILTAMTAAIADYDINVRHVDAGSSGERKAYANFLLDVRDRRQLDAVLRKLNQISGVISVSRIMRG